MDNSIATLISIEYYGVSLRRAIFFAAIGKFMLGFRERREGQPEAFVTFIIVDPVDKYKCST